MVPQEGLDFFKNLLCFQQTTALSYKRVNAHCLAPQGVRQHHFGQQIPYGGIKPVEFGLTSWKIIGGKNCLTGLFLNVLLI